MPQIQTKAFRNQPIECARMVAAFFVVFIHVPFPGAFGILVCSIGRFAVPMFFLISGYFSYQVSSERLASRVRKMLWLNVAATPLYIYRWSLLDPNFRWVFPGCILRLLPTKEQLVKWLVLDLNPYSEHLWYLTAIAVCYFTFWLYVRFFENGTVTYKPFYGICVCLGVIQFVLGGMASMLGVPIPYVLLRNGFFPGLSLFGLGLFLRQYRERIMVNYGLTDQKLTAVIILGIGYSLLRNISVGEIELSLGMVAAMAALMLLLENHSAAPVRSKIFAHCISKFGFLSTTIYIIHQFVGTVYQLHFQQLLTALLGAREAWIQPLIVLVISLAAAILCEQAGSLWKKMRKAC